MHVGSMGVKLLTFYTMGLDEGECELNVQFPLPPNERTLHRKLGDPQIWCGLGGGGGEIAAPARNQTSVIQSFY